MKTITRILLCATLGFVVLYFCSPARSGDAETAADPNAKTIAIVLGDKHWTIEELDKLARNRVWGQAGPSIQEVRQTVVQIRPRDQTIMCEFTYSAGFGKPFWRVEVGYDGKVQGVKKGTKREG